MGNIIIIGAITYDTLIYLEENNCRIIRGLGGIFHIVKALSVLSKYFRKLRRIKICHITNVGYDIYDTVINVMKSIGGNICLNAIQKYDSQNIHSLILFASEY